MNKEKFDILIIKGGKNGKEKRMDKISRRRFK